MRRGTSVWPRGIRLENGSSSTLRGHIFPILERQPARFSRMQSSSRILSTPSFPARPRYSHSILSTRTFPRLASRTYATEAQTASVDASPAANPSASTKKEKPITSRPDLGGRTVEEIEAFRYRGQSLITDPIKQLDLREVVVVLFRAQKYAPFDQQRIFAGWLEALARLRDIHQVKTLGEFLAMNRVAWWRSKVPQALRRLLNQAMYHQRWESYIVEGLAQVAEKKGFAKANSNSVGGAPSASS